MLYRKIEKLIDEHLKSDSKKILLIDGARQVGKTSFDMLAKSFLKISSK